MSSGSHHVQYIPLYLWGNMIYTQHITELTIHSRSASNALFCSQSSPPSTVSYSTTKQRLGRTGGSCQCLLKKTRERRSTEQALGFWYSFNQSAGVRSQTFVGGKKLLPALRVCKYTLLVNSSVFFSPPPVRIILRAWERGYVDIDWFWHLD